MDEIARRIFVRNEWFEHEGNRYEIRVFHDEDYFYLEVFTEDGRTAREPAKVAMADCIGFKRFNNPNLTEDMLNRMKQAIKKGQDPQWQ